MDLLYEDALLDSPKVFVYFNLHKHVFSVKALTGIYKGKVIAYANTLGLERCVFKVSEAGRQRVLLERRKNVHAGIEGFICSTDHIKCCKKEITYNPYKYKSFIYKEDGNEIHKSSHCFLIEKKAFVSK